MSLEIRSIGEVISYQATQRTEFIVGMGVIKSKTSENESITFNITQFIPIDVEDPCYVISLAPEDVVYFYGIVTKVDSSTQTINVTCSHSRKILLAPSSIPQDFTYVTAVGTVVSKPNITEETVSFDISLSQYIKTNTGGTYQPFTVTTFHSTKIKHLFSRTKIYNVGSRIKIEGAVELYNNIIYCELQHATFVIPKSASNNTNTSTTVSPPSSRRATIVRSIAEQSPPTKKPKLTNSSTTSTSETESSSVIQIEDINPSEDASDDIQLASTESKKTTATKSKRATVRNLASRKLTSEK